MSLDPSQKTKTGETIIHWACIANRKNPELLKMLLDFHDKWVEHTVWTHYYIPFVYKLSSLIKSIVVSLPGKNPAFHHF